MSRHGGPIVVPKASVRQGAKLDAWAFHRAIVDDPDLTARQLALLAAMLRHSDSETDDSPQKVRMFKQQHGLPAGTQAGRVRASLSLLAQKAGLDPDTVAGWLRPDDADYAPAVVDHLQAVQRPHKRLVQVWLPLAPLVQIDGGVRKVCAHTGDTLREHASLPV